MFYYLLISRTKLLNEDILKLRTQVKKSVWETLPYFNCRNFNFLSLPQGSESPMMIGELRSDLDDVDP